MKKHKNAGSRDKRDRRRRRREGLPPWLTGSVLSEEHRTGPGRRMADVK
jgi:hypothetical protein